MQLKASALPNVAVDSVVLCEAVFTGRAKVKSWWLGCTITPDEKAAGKDSIKINDQWFAKSALGSYTHKCTNAVQYDTLVFSGLAAWLAKRARIIPCRITLLVSIINFISALNVKQQMPVSTDQMEEQPDILI